MENLPATSAELMERLQKDWQAPTLLKLLSRLEERSFVAAEKQGRLNVYTPLVSQRDYLAAESKSFLQRLHGGSMSSLVAALCDGGGLTDDDLDALKALLEKGGRE